MVWINYSIHVWWMFGFSLDHIFQEVGDKPLVTAKMISGCVGTPLINTESHPHYPISSFSQPFWKHNRKFGWCSCPKPNTFQFPFLTKTLGISSPPDQIYSPWSSHNNPLDRSQIRLLLCLRPANVSLLTQEKPNHSQWPSRPHLTSHSPLLSSLPPTHCISHTGFLIGLQMFLPQLPT